MNRVVQLVPKLSILLPSIGFASCVAFCVASSPARGAWLELFNGTDLTSWQIGENADSFSVQDGMMVVNGPRAHAYYIGPDGEAGFKDFVFEAEVMTTLAANSGIYFHTHYQSENWPSTGYEAQINQTHSDPKKTGGLYAVQDNLVPVAQDYEWFHYEITVSGKRIVLKIDGQTITDYTEPDDLFRPWRQLGQGTFAIQSHHAGNPVYFRNMRVRPIPEPSSMVLSGLGMICLIAWRRRSSQKRSIRPICPDPHRASCQGRCRLKCSAIALSALALFAANARAVTIDTVPVGDNGNTPDQNYNELGQYGAVDHAYRIGKYEVTNGQYAEFLNAKAQSDPFDLYNTGMGSEIHGGISRSGVDGSFSYDLRPNMGNKPVNFVSFYDAIRFANWLHNGQGAGETETGAYTLSDGAAVARTAGAIWFLPTGDEWYKAAYYDPRVESEGGPAGDDNYWYYPTMSDSLPTSATANSVGDVNNPGINVMNYINGAVWNGVDFGGNVTTVGSAGPLSYSYYGTADQGGNVWEWSDQFGGDNRGLKGGAWVGDSGVTLSAYWSGYSHGWATDELFNAGFRVATVPEPSSLALAALALLVVGLGTFRTSKTALVDMACGIPVVSQLTTRPLR